MRPDNKVKKDYTTQKRFYYLIGILFLSLIGWYLGKNLSSIGLCVTALLIVGSIYLGGSSFSYLNLFKVDEKQSKLFLNIFMRGGRFYSESINVEPKRIKILNEYQKQYNKMSRVLFLIYPFSILLGVFLLIPTLDMECNKILIWGLYLSWCLMGWIVPIILIKKYSPKFSVPQEYYQFHKYEKEKILKGIISKKDVPPKNDPFRLYRRMCFCFAGVFWGFGLFFSIMYLFS